MSWGTWDLCEWARPLCVCVVGPHERVAGRDRSRGADLLQSARRAKRCREPITDGSKARPRPMRGLKRLRSARIIAAGPALIQNLRRATRSLPNNRHETGSAPRSTNSPSASEPGSGRLT